MAAIVVTGFEEYLDLLDTTERQARTMCGRAIHPGAKIVADECKKELEALRTDDDLFRISEKFGALRAGPTKRQKKALIESMGIAKMRRTGGGWDVKLGFDGYNDIVSDRWPKGQPNAMIARSVNKGTSFMQRQPFMDHSVRISEKRCIEAIEDEFNKQLEKYWGRK